MVTVPIIVGQILLEGMKLWSDERKHRFQKRYLKTLEKIDNEENLLNPDYNDARLMLAKQELDRFYKAYYEEIKSEVVSASNPN